MWGIYLTFLGEKKLNNNSEQVETFPIILPTNMVRRKKIVLKPYYDQAIIKLVAEKLKTKVFPRKKFRRPKASEKYTIEEPLFKKK